MREEKEMMMDSVLPCTLKDDGISQGVLWDLREHLCAAVQGVICGHWTTGSRQESVF